MTGLEFIFFVLRRAIAQRAISETELHRIINTTSNFVGLYAPVDGPEPEEILKLVPEDAPPQRPYGTVAAETGCHLVHPHVHLNGTSREALIAEWRRVYDAAQELQDALVSAMPHDRDYYLKMQGRCPARQLVSCSTTVSATPRRSSTRAARSWSD